MLLKQDDIFTKIEKETKRTIDDIIERNPNCNNYVHVSIMISTTIS